MLLECLMFNYNTTRYNRAVAGKSTTSLTQKMINMYKKMIYFIVLLVIYNCGLGYKVGGQRGYSKSVEESKERGVFVKELSYKIIPDTLQLDREVVFFIEEGFRYGSGSIFVTDTLIDKTYPYQLIFSRCRRACRTFKSCNYNCDTERNSTKDTIVSISLEKNSAERLELANNFIRDTITYDILYNIFPSYKVDTIGKIKVWGKTFLEKKKKKGIIFHRV